MTINSTTMSLKAESKLLFFLLIPVSAIVYTFESRVIDHTCTSRIAHTTELLLPCPLKWRNMYEYN